MHAARDAFRLFLKGLLTTLLLFAFAMTLSACGSRLLSRTAPPPSQTPYPTVAPTPRLTILPSGELYTGDERTPGETSPSHAWLPPGAVLPPAPSGESLHGVSVVLDARTVLRGELYQSAGGPQPGMLILGSDLSSWGNLPRQMSEAGFVVLVLQAEPTTQAGQIEAMLQSLIAIPGVDAGLLGVIGEAAAADLALLGCAVNSLCDALALLSPASRGTLLNMLPSYGARPLLLIASLGDRSSHETALALHRAAQGESYVLEANGGHGAAILLSSPSLANRAIEWFSQRLRRE